MRITILFLIFAPMLFIEAGCEYDYYKLVDERADLSMPDIAAHMEACPAIDFGTADLLDASVGDLAQCNSAPFSIKPFHIADYNEKSLKYNTFCQLIVDSNCQDDTGATKTCTTLHSSSTRYDQALCGETLIYPLTSSMGSSVTISFRYQFKALSSNDKATMRISLLSPTQDTIKDTKTTTDITPSNILIKSFQISSKEPVGFLRITVMSIGDWISDGSLNPDESYFNILTPTMQYTCP